MRTTSRLFAGVSSLWLVITFAPVARATPDFSGEIKSKLGITTLPTDPECLLCHTSRGGGLGTAKQLFGAAVLSGGLTPHDKAKLDELLDSFKNSNQDLDGDGMSDIDELKMGRNPNVASAGNGSVGNGGAGGSDAAPGGTAGTNAAGGSSPVVPLPSGSAGGSSSTTAGSPSSGSGLGGSTSTSSIRGVGGSATATNSNGLVAPGSNDTWDNGCTLTEASGNRSRSPLRLGIFTAAAALWLGRRRRARSH